MNLVSVFHPIIKTVWYTFPNGPWEIPAPAFPHLIHDFRIEGILLLFLFLVLMRTLLWKQENPRRERQRKQSLAFVAIIGFLILAIEFL